MEGRATITHAASDRFLPLSLSLRCRCRLCFLASPAGRRGHVVSKGRHHAQAGPTGPSQARSPTACLVCPSGERALRAGVGLSQQREGSRALSWPAGGTTGALVLGTCRKGNKLVSGWATELLELPWQQRACPDARGLSTYL